MSTHRSLATTLLFLSSLAFLGFSSCQPKQRVPSPTEKHYDLKGKVISVDKEKRELTIAHGDIKDYMSGMTMAFSVKDDWVYEIAAPGNHITATLVVDGTQSWLEDVGLAEDSQPGSGGPAIEGADLKVGDQVPDYRLINQDGKTIRIQDYKGKALLLTFIYTPFQDPNQCTLMSSNFP